MGEVNQMRLSGGPFAKASVENLASGAKRDFALRGAGTLELDLSHGPLAVVLEPAARPGGEKTAVAIKDASKATAKAVAQ